MKYLILLAFCFMISFARAEDVNILDFDAIPDGKTLATEAIQRAIDSCAASGGGTVTVPVGTFLTNTIFLKSKVNLHLKKGAEILGSTHPEAFTMAVIYADSIRDADITGQGVINGQGFKNYFPRSGPRHHNICLFKCQNITVKDITLINSSNWVFRIRECDGIRVRGVRIYSFANENNDGIDIDGKNITVSDCIIDCDDDAVCLKSDNPEVLIENVSITNCIIASNCNAIKFGTASHCGFNNVAISNCIIRRPSEAAHRRWSETQGVTSDTTVISGLALEVVDGGVMDQVTITNISMTGIQTPLFIRLGNRSGRGVLKNVIISNINATNESLMTSSITGIPGSYVENVSVSDVTFTCKGTGTIKEANLDVPEKEETYPENRMFGYSLPSYGLYARHVKDLTFENFRFNLQAPDARPAVILDDCHGIKLDNFTVDPPSDKEPLIRLIQSTNVSISGYQGTESILTFLCAEGERTKNINLTGNDFSNVKNVIRQSKDCKSEAIKMMGNYR